MAKGKPKKNVVEFNDTRKNFAGTEQRDVVTGNALDNQLFGGEKRDTLFGEGGNDLLAGEAGNDQLFGGEGNDTILGGAGNDKMNGGAGTNTVDGGDGEADMLVSSGNFADAKITKTVDGTGYIITTASGTTTVNNVELFQFADGVKQAKDLIVTDPTLGKTVTLTTNVDAPGAIAPAVDTTGSSANDTYKAVLDGTGAGNVTTLNIADSIDALAGVDTLSVRSTANGGTLSAATAPVLNGIEVIEATNLNAAGTFTANLLGISPALTTFNNVGSLDNVAVQNASKAVTTLGLSNITADNADFSVAYAAGLTGLADAVTLNVSNNSAATPGTAANFAEVAIAGAAVGDGVDVLTVNSTGGATRLDKLTAADSGATSTLATLTVTGDKNFRVNQALDFVGTAGTVDAAKFTGNLNLTFGTENVKATGGTGNDRFAFATAGDLTTADVINGGTGTDTVAIADTTIDATTTALNKAINGLTSIETLELTGGATTLVASAITAINSFAYSGGVSIAVSGVEAGDSFSLESDLTANSTFAPAIDTGADVLNLSVTGVDVAATKSISAAAFETVNLTVTNDVGNDDNVLQTFVVNTNGKLDIGGAGDVTLTVQGTNATLDAGDLTGKANLTGEAGNNSIIGGSNNDYITGAAGIDSINLTKGGTDFVNISDNVTFASAANNRDVVTGFTAGAGGDVIDILAATGLTTDQVTAATANYKDFTGTSTGFTLTNTFDVFEFGFDAANNAANLANATDGSELFKAIANEGSSITSLTLSGADTGYIVAYDNGNAYVYFYDSADASLSATEVALVATLNGVAAGSLTHDNFA